MKKQALWLFLFCAFSMNAQNTTPQYKNAKLPTDVRVKDLMSRMKVEEKVAQMLCHWESQASFRVLDSLTGDLNEARLATRAPHGLGEVARPSEGRGKGMGKGPQSGARIHDFVEKHKRYFAFEERRVQKSGDCWA